MLNAESSKLASGNSVSSAGNPRTVLFLLSCPVLGPSGANSAPLLLSSRIVEMFSWSCTSFRCR